MVSYTLSLGLCENLHSSIPMKTSGGKKKTNKKNRKGHHKENTPIINNGKQVDHKLYIDSLQVNPNQISDTH